jgi:Holliday junction DNA helicase RuvA
MIIKLKGTIKSVRSDYLILDVNGVGYRVESAAPYRIGLEEGEVEIYTYTYLRQDDVRLFGFNSLDQLDLFEKLLSVSGIGPKSAELIVSTYSVKQIVAAINGNSPENIKVKGVGTKTLAKLVIELKGKLEQFAGVEDKSEGSKDQQSQIDLVNDSERELLEAMIGLGYTAKEIESIKDQIDYEKAFAEQIRQALALLRG